MNATDYIPIYPNLKKISTICKFKLRIASCVLFTNANIEVQLYDENDRIIDTRYIFLTGDEYTAWENDKDLVAIIKKKLQQ